MKNNRVTIILVSFFIILGVSFLGYFYKVTHAATQQSSLPVFGNDLNHHVAPFSFVNQDGKTITNQDMKGKIVVIEYFFATCKGICPKMNENLEKVYREFKGNKDVLFFSHTVDPKKDTVQALKAYSQRFGADANQWMFLTGSKKELYDMARFSYLIDAEEDTAGISVDKDFIHDNHYMLIENFGPEGRVRGAYDGLQDSSVKRLMGDIKLLLQEKRNMTK